MIQLSNVTKKYTSKSNRECVALNNVTLNFPDAGLVVIVGKSGSGKTTLLNLIGGLDVPNAGTVSVDHSFLAEEKMLDYYRNEYIGFIFQDFNLIDHETITENLKLSLLLQQSKNYKSRIDEALAFVGMSGYQDRFPNELSGGQKQRIAIARAIAKNSKIVLADEPTGNLDEENSSIIINLLKSISMSKLVILVTHDIANFKKHADRIIELKDGSVHYDSQDRENSIHPSRQLTIKKSKSLSLLLTTKMGLHNLFKKKIKTTITVFISLLSVFLLGYAHILSTFTAEEALAKTIVDNQINSAILYQNENESFVSPFSPWVNIDDSIYDSLLNLERTIKKIDDYYMIQNKQQMLEYGFVFYAVNDIDDESIYVTDYLIDGYKNTTIQLTTDFVDYETYNPDIQSFDYLLGKYIFQSGNNVFKGKIAGVIKTDYKSFFDDSMREFTTTQIPYMNETLYFGEMQFKKDFSFENQYATSNFIRKAKSSLQYDGSNYITTITTTRAYNFSTDENAIIYGDIGYADVVLTNTGVFSLSELTLEHNEVVISMALYNRIFNNEIVFNEYVEFDTESFQYVSKKTPLFINTDIHISVSKTINDTVLINDLILQIVGVSMESSIGSDDTSNYEIFANQSMILEYAHTTFSNSATMIKITSDYNHLHNLLSNMRNRHNVVINTVYSESIYQNEQVMRNISIIFWIFGIVTGIITVLINISLISYSILNRRKDIGILRALGATNRDVRRIFIVESFIISITNYVLSLSLIFIFIRFTNHYSSQTSLPNTTFMTVSLNTTILMFLASIMLMNMTAIIPVMKVSKMKPIDAIKNTSVVS